jgi:hypothetical protein
MDPHYLFITVKASADRDLEHKNEALKRKKELEDVISAFQVHLAFTSFYQF